MIYLAKELGKFENYNYSLAEFERIGLQASQGLTKLMVEQETAVHRHTRKNPRMLQALQEFQTQNDTDYPHSIVQAENSPKMVIIGTPRSDRHDTVNRFYQTMIDEKVRVIIALNTASDWADAIPYYEETYVNDVQLDGWSIKRTAASELYEGQIATNFPAKILEQLELLPESERAVALRNDDMKQYRPRIFERTFTLTEERSGDTRTLTQLHYENWPDRQHAPDLEALWVLLQRQVACLTDNEEAMAIHCQGGIGRTNFHAILSWLIKEIDVLHGTEAKLADATFNIPEMMYRLKEQAARLGGSVCGRRFGQIYEMASRYYKSLG